MENKIIIQNEKENIKELGNFVKIKVYTKYSGK